MTETPFDYSELDRTIEEPKDFLSRWKEAGSPKIGDGESEKSRLEAGNFIRAVAELEHSMIDLRKHKKLRAEARTEAVRLDKQYDGLWAEVWDGLHKIWDAENSSS